MPFGTDDGDDVVVHSLPLVGNLLSQVVFGSSWLKLGSSIYSCLLGCLSSAGGMFGVLGIWSL